MTETLYRTAVVTGASSGIGRAITAALCKLGLAVHGVARRREPLEQLARETGCTPHVADVDQTAQLEAALADLEVDILVNNAGLGRGYDGLVNTTPGDIERVITTNVIAVLQASRIAMTGMVARRRGHIVNIGSIAGLHPTGFGLYAASKGAIHLLSQNLRLELRGTGVRVTEICPGRVETPFFDTAFDDPVAACSFTTGFSCLSPEDVADAVAFAVSAPWRCNVATIELLPTEQAVGGARIYPIEASSD